MLTYTNPVLDVDFADPTVIRASDGRYYGYATQTIQRTRRLNIQVVSSDDLVHWSAPVDAMPVKPTWAAKTQDVWAPCVDERDGMFVMYYSGKPDRKHGLGIGVAVADNPLGPFKDAGEPLARGRGFVNIDPMAFDDPVSGRRLLYWGSGFQAIRCQDLTLDRLRLRPDSRSVELIQPCRDRPYERLVEGAFVHYRAPYYYLFYSGDNCWGPIGSYAVMVARSTEPCGPFESLAATTGRPHSAILEANELLAVPGHNSIVTDVAGQDWIVYHAVDLRRDRLPSTADPQRYMRRVMCIDRLEYRDGWPFVAQGTASTGPRPAPVTRQQRGQGLEHAHRAAALAV